MLAFGDYLLDPYRRALYRQDARLDITGRPLDILIVLIRERGQVVTRESLRQEIWSGLTVTTAAIEQAVHRLRTILNENRAQPQFIETVQGDGYRFIGHVTEVGEPSLADTYRDRAGFPRSRRRRWAWAAAILIVCLSLACAAWWRFHRA